MTDFVELLRAVQSGRDSSKRSEVLENRTQSATPMSAAAGFAAGLVDLIVLVEADDSRVPIEVTAYIERALREQRPAWAAAARSLGALWSWKNGDEEEALDAMVSAERELAIETALPPLDQAGDPTGIGAAANNMGVLFLLMHLFELAEPHLLRAARESKNYAASYQPQHCVDMANLAELYFRWGLEADACGHPEQVRRLGAACTEAADTMADAARAQNWPEAQRFAGVLQLAAKTLRDPTAVSAVDVTTITDLITEGVMGGTGTMAVCLAALARASRLAADPIGARAAADQASQLELDDLLVDGAWREAALASNPSHAAALRYADVRSQRLESRRTAAVRDFRRRLSLAHLRRSHRSLARLTERDPLTGVGNRLMLERLGDDPSYARAGLLLLDVDRFKNINDGYGHVAGDRVLELVAHVAVTAVGDTGAVVRLGGDEFAVLVRDAEDEQLHRIAQHIGHGVAHGRRPSADVPAATVSIGWTVPVDARPPLELLAEADGVMYEAKRDGGGRIRPKLPGARPLQWPDCDLCADSSLN